MPSWKVHCLIGEIICFGFCNHEIDALIDVKGRHDRGRYDKSVFTNEALTILRKYGANGLCYYILHHILDRLQELLISELAHGYNLYTSGHDINSVYEKVRSNIISRIRNDTRTIFSTYLEEHSDRPEDEILNAMIRLVLAGIESGIDCILFFLISDVNSEGKPTTGTRTYIAILNKLFGEGYRIYRDAEAASRYVEIHHKYIIEYLTNIIEPAQNMCREIEGKISRNEKLLEELSKIFEIFEKHGIQLYILKRLNNTNT